jgi:hypothetical protein
MRSVASSVSLLVPAVGILLIMAVSAGAEDDTKLIMHAIPHDQRAHCYLPAEQGYGDPATQTVVSVAPDADVDVFVYLADYDRASGARGAGFRLVWPADWTYFGWAHNCTPGQITLIQFGDSDLDVGTAFNVVTSGELIPLGYLGVRTGTAGELRVEETQMCPYTGICYVDDYAREIRIKPGNIGRVGVGSGFNPAAPTPVEPATWGDIKAQYFNARDR